MPKVIFEDIKVAVQGMRAVLVYNDKYILFQIVGRELRILGLVKKLPSKDSAFRYLLGGGIKKYPKRFIKVKCTGDPGERPLYDTEFIYASDKLKDLGECAIIDMERIVRQHATFLNSARSRFNRRS